jgi:hypothetical protein
MESEFPQPIADMAADLAGQGFDIVEERRTADGRLRFVLQGPVKIDGHWLEAFVLISAERARWSLSVRFEGMSRWIPVRAWLAYLDREPPGPAGLERAAAFIRDRLAEAGRVFDSTPRAEDDLVRLTSS